eukprot:5391326-Alexandrium_andersonii.AAC.1
MAGRQWVSCRRTVGPARSCSVTAASLATVLGARGCAIHLTFQEQRGQGGPVRSGGGAHQDVAK